MKTEKLSNGLLKATCDCGYTFTTYSLNTAAYLLWRHSTAKHQDQRTRQQIQETIKGE